MKNDLIENLNLVFISWFMKTNKHVSVEDLTSKREEIMKNVFFAEILIKRLAWAKVDVVIPDELLIIISACAETPAEVLMITTDIFDDIMNIHNYDKLPVGYVITPTDFSHAFPFNYPITSIYKEMKDRYNKKWDNQKIKPEDMKDYIIDNMYDTKEFWEKYKNT